MQEQVGHTPFSAEKLFSDSQSREFISPAEIKGFFWEHYHAILIPLVICVAVAFLYASLATPIFTARVQLLIDPKTPILREQSGEVNFSLDSAQVESHIAILRSEKIASTVIKELGLADSLEPASNSPLSMLRGWFASDSEPESEFIKDRQAIGIFDQALITRRLGRSYAIEIAFRSSNPEKAATIANAVAAAYIRDQIDSKSDSAHQGSIWLEGRLAELRSQMNDATRKVQNFRATYDYAVSSPPTDAARQAGSQKQAPAAADRGLEKTTLEELETTAETYRRIYESFLQAYTASVQRQSYPVSDVRIITPATAPLSKSSPVTSLIVAFGALLGLTIGFVIAIAKHFARRY